jgi:hypothetical protein
MDLLAQAWQPLIVCDGPNCHFGDLIKLAQNLITNLVLISTLLATMAFAYAGFLLLTSGGSEENRKKATTIFTKVLKGYLWILAAWLLIYTITSLLLKQGFFLLGTP